MRVRRHFRTSKSTIDYIIADFSLNRISNKNTYFMICVNDRLNKLNEEYNHRIDKILNFIIRKCNFTDLPIDSIARVMYSISKVTNALTRGILSLIKE